MPAWLQFPGEGWRRHAPVSCDMGQHGGGILPLQTMVIPKLVHHNSSTMKFCYFCGYAAFQTMGGEDSKLPYNGSGCWPLTGQYSCSDWQQNSRALGRRSYFFTIMICCLVMCGFFQENFEMEFFFWEGKAKARNFHVLIPSGIVGAVYQIDRNPFFFVLSCVVKHPYFSLITYSPLLQPLYFIFILSG